MSWREIEFPKPPTPQSEYEYGLYVEGWTKMNADQIIKELVDERFIAEIDFYVRGLLSHFGLLHRVFNDPDYVFSPRFGPRESRGIIDGLAAIITDRKMIDTELLYQKFPEIYEYYCPEAFGTHDLPVKSPE